MAISLKEPSIYGEKKLHSALFPVENRDACSAEMGQQKAIRSTRNWPPTPKTDSAAITRRLVKARQKREEKKERLETDFTFQYCSKETSSITTP